MCREVLCVGKWAKGTRTIPRYDSTTDYHLFKQHSKPALTPPIPSHLHPRPRPPPRLLNFIIVIVVITTS
jgi:hypothetical protein